MRRGTQSRPAGRRSRGTVRAGRPGPLSDGGRGGPGAALGGAAVSPPDSCLRNRADPAAAAAPLLSGSRLGRVVRGPRSSFNPTGARGGRQGASRLGLQGLPSRLSLVPPQPPTRQDVPAGVPQSNERSPPWAAQRRGRAWAGPTCLRVAGPTCLPPGTDLRRIQLSSKFRTLQAAGHPAGNTSREALGRKGQRCEVR